MNEDELRRLRRLHTGAVEKHLDAGHGACCLKQPHAAKIVAEALRQFDGVRYDLLAWCVMPNHVHVVIQPLEGFGVQRILHTWMSHTAREINKLLKRGGDLWQAEYCDFAIRDAAELRNAARHTLENPASTGIINWRWKATNQAKLEALLGEKAELTQATPTEHDAVAPIDSDGSIGAENPAAFKYVRSRLGLDTGRTLQVGSPFDYAQQARLLVESHLPEPNDPAFLPAACERILHYLNMTRGGAFVLFTSYSMLSDAAERLRQPLEEAHLPLLVQGQARAARAARAVSRDARRGALRDQQLLAGHRRAGRSASQRHHRQASLRRPR